MNRKKVLSFLMAALFVLVCAGMASAALTPNAEGVYEIGTEEGLAWFRNAVNAGSTDIDARLTADITLTGNWAPIGWRNSEPGSGGGNVEAQAEAIVLYLPVNYSYSGTFDGGGKTISGLKITSDDAVDCFVADWDQMYAAGGLFGVISADGVVKNLTVADAEINLDDTVNYPLAGALAGYSEGRLENVRVVGGVISSWGDTGGVAGSNNGGAAIIINCTASGIKSIAGDYVGGVVGYNYYGAITNCTVRGIENIDGDSAGGVVGYNYYGTITNCTASGIEGIEGYYAGGVVGYNSGTVTNSTASGIEIIEGYSAGGVVGQNWYGEIANCIASGIKRIYGNGDAGGVVGENYYGTVANCTASGIGEIIGEGDTAGGIVGDNFGPVRNCMASDIGLLEGGNNAGGITGYNVNNAAVTNCVLLAGGAPTVLSGDSEEDEGGAIGYLSDGTDSLSNIQNCLYPSNVTFTHDEDKPIGNIPLGDMVEQYNVTTYSADVEDLSKLQAIVAILKQGVAVEVQKGKTYTLDVTTLPGTLGFENLTFDWDTDDVSGDVIAVESIDDAIVTLRGVELGTANVFCTVSGDIEAELTCAVTVIAAKPDDNGGGGSSSNCSTFGFGFAALALLPFLYRRKR